MLTTDEGQSHKYTISSYICFWLKWAKKFIGMKIF